MENTTNNATFDSILTLQDVMKYLKISRSMIYKMMDKGEIKGFKIGNQWRFKKEDIDSFINNQTNK